MFSSWSAHADEMGGSHYHLVAVWPAAKFRKWTSNWHREFSPRFMRRSSADSSRSCHDLSEGGLAIAVAEMAFAGGVGAT